MNRFVLIALAIAAAPAHAQNASAEADALFDKGKALMAKNDFAGACQAFEESQKLAAATTTQMNLANCREKNNQLATAHELFLQVGAALESKTDAANKKLREVAVARGAALAPKLSKLTLIVPTASQLAGLEITRDATPIARTEWNQPIALDGGSYTIVVRAPDRVEWTTTVTLAPSKDTKTLEVPVLASGESSTTTATTAPITTDKPTPPPSAGGSKTLPIVFGVSAVVLGGAALGFELWGRSIYSDAEDTVGDRTEQVRLWDAANLRHYIAQGAGIAAIGCAGAAVIFLVTRDKGTESSAVTVAPVTTPTSIGVGAFARW